MIGWLLCTNQATSRPLVQRGQALVYLVFVGLLALAAAGLALDVGRLLLHRQAALSLADSAAHAGAQQVDPDYYRQTGGLRLLTAARRQGQPNESRPTAEQAAARILAAAGLPPCQTGQPTCASITVRLAGGPGSTDVIEVTIRQAVGLTLMRFSTTIDDTIVIEGTSSATPRLTGGG